MDTLTLKDKFEELEHIFTCYDWDASEGWIENLLTLIVPIVQQFYIDCESLKKNLEDIGFDDSAISIFIDEALTVMIPDDTTDKGPKNFSIRRADFSEIMALICLQNLYNTCVSVKNIYYIELTHAAGRGVDILGYEMNESGLHLVICEVKASKDRRSPPSVIDSAESSMKEQLYSYISNKKKTLNRILNTHKKASDEHKEVLTRIAFLWLQENIDPLKVVVCPFLVRQADCYQATDYGFFRNEVGVQIITGLVCRQGQPACIDIIGTFFEWRDFIAALGQSSHNAD